MGDLRVPTAPNNTSQDDLLDLNCATRWHQHCQLYESGDFGRSPFFGQLSGKHPACQYVCICGTKIKAQ